MSEANSSGTEQLREQLREYIEKVEKEIEAKEEADDGSVEYSRGKLAGIKIARGAVIDHTVQSDTDRDGS